MAKKKQDRPDLHEVVRYSSVGELQKDYFRKDWTWWDYIESWWYKFFWNWFSSIPAEIKYFIQRGVRGYSDRDLWDFSDYLVNLLLSGLVEYKSISTGHPPHFTEGEWRDILNGMIEGFTIVKKCQIGDEMFWGGMLTKAEKTRTASNKIRWTTTQEERQVMKAFKLLRDNFWSLWD